MEHMFLKDTELAEMLNLSVKTIRNNSFRIVGRTTIGRTVRYDKDLILYTLRQGKEIFKNGGRK